jgi:pectate lyase
MKRPCNVLPALLVMVGTALSAYADVPAVSSWYNLTGFGYATTGGGVIPETDPAYVKVTNALDLANAIRSANKTAGSVKVIEIMNDLNLGWNEVDIAVRTNASTPFRQHNTPLLHPVLLVSGVSLIDIQPKSGLTIFSANGSTIRHATFNLKNASNIIVRNLKFDEMWEWDESTKGAYDRNDWDFMDFGNGGGVLSNVWVDHCTFTKAYDGVGDIKGGANHITLSWNKYTGDDGATNPNSFVWQQINALESNKASYAMYNSLRTSSGFSTTDIVTIIQGHDKTHLIGATSFAADNSNLWVTLHHQWFINPWDRLPRLRSGNVHDYNLYVDDTLALAAKRLRDQHTINSSYSFNPPVNGSISTEDGAVLVEKSVYIDSLWPLRNNQTDPSQDKYTGKIMALDCIYHFDNTDNSTVDFRGDSIPYNSPGWTNFGPKQAVPPKAFSWNLPGNQLPYTYTMHDPSQLHDILTSSTAGAGAGVLTWAKSNWLMTAYSDTAPVIDTSPQSVTVSNGQTAAFAVAAYGSLPLWYQWYFNTNSPVAGGTNMTLVIASAQSSDVGTYSVVVSNSVGAVASAYATLSLAGEETPPTPFEDWQMQYFGCTNVIDCPQADPAADPDGDGQNNMAEFLSGTDPTNNASALRITSVFRQDNDVVITWTTAGGKTNAVQASGGDLNSGFTTNDFADLGDSLIISGSGDTTTNYVDRGATTNGPSRFYRIRLVP